ncbi:hypothetical protein CONPUDRAFT_101339 [Coniophora puteana RWD-64-598 SS2]|uniref:RING-type E3 ubiquitin transferase n=1 Tax=Coniophora puteana (strain RWD-64-598) TaxID=741705 RepID=A0A5M3MUN4_CONPW|nr:uncharacterized protein CONPUDRAFT_101339 [Coniophora puteana RWD-64-598 SS2]EIW82888.1 hypothetical protein CONPUDRAFT_101339 [Coniophora puteana RWD-64-598 SS2]
MPTLRDMIRGRVGSPLTYHRMLLYGVLSTAAVSVTIANALQSHSNFYSLAIYLSKSNRSVLILANFGVLVALLCGQVFQRIFFGELRAQEVERLYDRLWIFVTESLLAFTIFRDDFDIPFAMMFGFLLFVKSFHWLASDRIEWMDQRPYPGPPALFHLRMVSLLGILSLTDVVMFAFAAESTTRNGVGGMMMFGSEYAILMASAMNTTAKYLVCVNDLRRARQRGGENAPPWQNKSMWLFYIELATDFFKLTTYLIFFMVIVAFYGLPLNIIRDVYLTGRSFITRLRALFRYRAATRNMDQRYPNATQEEMSAMSDRTCIICREEMNVQPDNADSGNANQGQDGPNMTPKRLPCGHVFHFYCLRSWLERQQSCPTCRRSVLETPGQPQPQPNGRAPPPQPGAAPRAPNLVGGQGGAGGAPLNNPFGGLLGHLVGNGAQPPIVPGQFANAPLPPNLLNNLPNQAQNAGQQAWPGQTPGVLVQYNIYRQGDEGVPRPSAQRADPTTPAPRFMGFFGPGGNWHQWNMDQRWFEGRQNGAAPQPTSTNTSASSIPESESSTSTTAPPAESPLIQESRIADETESSTPPSRPETPREAAAQAALRRFGGGSGTQRPAQPTHISFSDTSAGNIPRPTPTVKNGSTPSVPASERWDIPSLIPLDDISADQGSFGASTSPPQGHAATFPSPSSSQVPLTQLPSVISDAQLATMDRVTREAVDERLRVLENISITVNRCMDDLMRLRSAMPPPLSPDLGQNAQPSVPPAPQPYRAEGESSSNSTSRTSSREEVPSSESY